jgi:hypothetical protein
MRITLFILLAVLCFSACTTYQYVSIDSSQLQKAKDDRLLSENDTMQVIYSFAGPGGDVTVTILNKLSEPIYIDWSRSALIRNDQSFTIRRKDLLLIPPQSNVSAILLNLNEQAGGIPRLGVPDTAHTRRYKSPTGLVAHYKAADYTEANSPIHLRSYLTFLFGPNGSVDRSVTHTFYAGESAHSDDPPLAFSRYHAYGNMLYVWYK